MAEQKAPTLEELVANSSSMFTNTQGILQKPVAPPAATPPATPPAAEPPAAPPETPPATPPVETPPATPPVTPPATPPETPPASTEKKIEKISTTLFDITLQEGATTATSGDEALALFNQKTGLNIQKPEDVLSMADQIAEAINTKVQIDEKLRSALEYKEFFENLSPPELRAVNIAYLEGKDYKAMMRAMSDQSIDFTKRFSEYSDVYNVVAKYNPEMTREEFDDLEEANRKTIVKTVERAYNLEFDEHVRLQKEYAKKKEDKATRLHKSIELSMDNLKKEFPKLSKKELDAIYEKHNRGIREDLFDADGLYKADAGVKIAMATFGKQTIDQMISHITAKHASEKDAEIAARVSEERELMNRGRNDTIPTGGASPEKKTPEEQVMKNVGDMFISGQNSFSLANRETKK